MAYLETLINSYYNVASNWVQLLFLFITHIYLLLDVFLFPSETLCATLQTHSITTFCKICEGRC